MYTSATQGHHRALQDRTALRRRAQVVPQEGEGPAVVMIFERIMMIIVMMIMMIIITMIILIMII